MVKIALDAREMQHPEPLTKSIEYLKTMRKDSYLYMLNKKKPYPLLEIATKQAFHILTHEDAQGIWHILIAKVPCDLRQYLDV